ncbi:hypothetical protein AKJ36_01720 [candidate division MSBL1 archaeon SCGC-AAA259I07]|uniref:Uncharacterized protein n=1 Tax=candidate division MSBL1 archaeon SCGC-AAA259I07 TaxID=1698266 RepID=A0A133ULA6_9EURY|nr:hypothetical protein AKJ36_01720 [candidate division MSBL1 archaeon SCGC-AAA259I07]
MVFFKKLEFFKFQIANQKEVGLLKTKRSDGKIFVRLNRGEEVIAKMKELREKYDIKNGFFHGIGAVDKLKTEGVVNLFLSPLSPLRSAPRPRIVPSSSA